MAWVHLLNVLPPLLNTTQEEITFLELKYVARLDQIESFSLFPPFSSSSSYSSCFSFFPSCFSFWVTCFSSLPSSKWETRGNLCSQLLYFFSWMRNVASIYHIRMSHVLHFVMRDVYTLLSITNFWVNFDKLVEFQLFWTVLIYLNVFVKDQAVASSGSLFLSEQKEKGLSFSQGKVLVVCM